MVLAIIYGNMFDKIQNLSDQKFLYYRMWF